MTHIHGWAVLCTLFVVTAGGPVSAATICVNAKPKPGCYLTITAGITAAQPHDTVQVAQGTYHEEVIINKSLSLVGFGASNTILDASSNNNGVGIYVDGMDNLRTQDIADGNLSGLSDVVVRGFTVTNAKFEGILVSNASNVMVVENHVTGNNTILDAQNQLCGGLPDWETSEGFDCGEGIHLVAVDHSLVADNRVDHNAGGILLTDETGPNHDNQIVENTVTENPIDCGITLASHKPAPNYALTPYGVFHNTIAFNESTRNGVGALGNGVGIGLFTSGGHANTATYGNVVIGNRTTENGHTGIALHAHRNGAILIDNVIVGNYIARNGADTGDTSTSGPTGVNVSAGNSAVPLTGTVISGNAINDEAIDVAVKTPAQIEIHLNNLQGDGAAGVSNLGGGAVNATQNWWGCAGGPTAQGCSTVQGADIIFTPWLTRPFNQGGH